MKVSQTKGERASGHPRPAKKNSGKGTYETRGGAKRRGANRRPREKLWTVSIVVRRDKG